ncbi:MAG: hypothetical protein UY96_C0017G0021 [Parcubacteria group bacterium GW2011_GWB1_56_8]|nr:MAG: hypothetical protein UY96_C0017G0021 [Parcubacteria group bacterium GW2011_GWB1_56_8]
MRLLAVIALLTLAACANTSKAENLAREYATANYPGHEIVNVSCQNTDSDGDGYVSCNLSLRTPKDEILTPPIECSGGWIQLFANGCRYPKAHSK